MGYCPLISLKRDVEDKAWRLRKACRRRLLAAAALLCVLGTPLAGAQSSMPPEAGCVTNGTVRTIAYSEDTVYIGGSFTEVGPYTGGGVPFDTATGQMAAVFPKVIGRALACLSDGSGGWFIGGEFTQIGGLARNNIAHVLSDGTVDPAWDANADSSVFALAVSGTTVYAGGYFTSIGGQTRNRIAALDGSTGNVTAWNPNANNIVKTLVVSGTTVYAGGNFSSVGGQTRQSIAALDAATGNATAWNPNPNWYVSCLAVSGTTVYAGGWFSNIGGQTRNGIAALDAATGNATAWNPNASRWVEALAVSGTTIYAGGDFTNIGGQARNYIAALDAATGNATAWNPNASYPVFALAVSGSTVYAGGQFSSIGGQARNYIAALDAATGNATAWNPKANDRIEVLAVSGTTVYAGGRFSSIDGQTRNRIAALDRATGGLAAWDPNPDGDVNALAVSGSTVYAGGGFSSVGGQTRNRIAALDVSTGNATAWNPNADNDVNALAVSGSTAYAGGTFSSIGGQTRNRIAALDAATGNATAWDPNASGRIYVLAASGSTVYAGGAFHSIGGQSREALAALDAATGNATAWDPDPSDDPPFSPYVHALAVSGTTVYVGGEFRIIGGQTRYSLAALDAATGNATAWNPYIWVDVYALAVSGPWVYAGGNFTEVGGVSRHYFAEFGSVPTAPTNPGATAITQNSMTWTWTDNADGESGYLVYAGPGGTPPGTAITTTTANVTQWAHTGLSPNTQYAFQVATTNRYGDSAKTTNYTAWTLIEPVSGLAFSSVGTNSISVAASNTPSNLSAGTSGLCFANTTAGSDGGWQQSMVPWASAGLTPNTQYAFSGRSRNGDGVETTPVSDSEYTLAAAPSIGNNVTCDRATGTLYPAGTTFAFSNPAGFGPGTHGGNAYRLSRFEYAWDGSPTYTFTGAEPPWNAATLPESPVVSGSYYLHLQSFNEDGLPGGTLDYGPFDIDVDAPTAAMTLLTTSPTGADAINFQVAFSEPVAPTFDGGDVSVAGTLAGAVAVTGTDPTYTVTVTLTDPDADGTVGIDVAGGGAVTDLGGNPYAGGSSPLAESFNWRGFTSEPQSVQAYNGDDPTFTVVADCGASTLLYQWKWDDGVSKTIHDVGSDSPSHTVTDCTTGHAGDYWCEVSYDGSTYPTAAAALEVEDHLQIIQPPQGGDKIVDDAHVFTVATTGGYLPLSYEWRKNGGAIAGAMDPSYTLDPLTMDDAGTYTVQVFDYNTDIEISDAAVLTVTPGVPVAGLMGLGVLCTAFVLGGAALIRRKS